MISYLKGKIVLKREDSVVVNTGGVGYEAFVSEKTALKLPNKGSDIELFCHLDVTERNFKLFGFLEHKEVELFRLVRGIAGIGPKAALEISSLGSPEEVKKEIDKENLSLFEKVPGIGRKKAQKIVLELSGKLKLNEHKSKEDEDTVDALRSLGLKKSEAKEALSRIPDDIKETEEKVREALKILGK